MIDTEDDHQALCLVDLVDNPITTAPSRSEISQFAFIANCTDTLATKTVLLITHRPAALALATRQVVMT